MYIIVGPYLDEAVLLLGVFQDDDAARVGAHNDVVPVPACQPERHQRPNLSENFRGHDSLHLARLIRPQQLQDFAA